MSTHVRSSIYLLVLTCLQDEPFLMVKRGPNKDGLPILGHERYEGMLIKIFSFQCMLS